MKVIAWLCLLLVLTVSLTGLLPAPARAQTAPAAPEAQQPNPPEAVAAMSDVFYVPGKVVTCAGGIVMWIVTMGVTFGTQYDEAARILKGGCGGRWGITPEDVKPALDDQ